MAITDSADPTKGFAALMSNDQFNSIQRHLFPSSWTRAHKYKIKKESSDGGMLLEAAACKM